MILVYIQVSADQREDHCCTDSVRFSSPAYGCAYLHNCREVADLPVVVLGNHNFTSKLVSLLAAEGGERA